MINNKDMEFAEYIPKQDIKNLVIMLHGYGADKNDLIGLASHLGKDLPNTAFISPDAIQPCEIGFGRQWFSIGSTDENETYDKLENASLYINEFIKQQIKRFNLSPDKVALVGFSQGTMLSLHIAPRQNKQFACVVGFSGILVGCDVLAEKCKTKPPICLIHGDADEIVDVKFTKLARDCLTENNFVVEDLICSGLGHSINHDGLSFATKFLQKHLIK